MNIFLCYPSAERATADQINLALVGQGHDVFFDRDDLPAGDEYHQRISRAIEQSHVFLFLITPDSLAKGRYTLTELDIALAKWEHPAGHVLPVMVQPTPIKDVPPYLRAVTILEPKGDVAANVARAVSQLFFLRAQEKDLDQSETSLRYWAWARPAGGRPCRIKYNGLKR